MTEPKWHGWATPEQVNAMMIEMYQFLMENNENCTLAEIVWQKSAQYAKKQIVRIEKRILDAPL